MYIHFKQVAAFQMTGYLHMADVFIFNSAFVKTV